MPGIQHYSFSPHTLSLTWSDGRQSLLDALWLRDHCQMPECRDSFSGQRLTNITEIAADITISKVDLDRDTLHLEFAPDAHHSAFTLDWLLQHCYCLNPPHDERSANHKQLWQAAAFDSGLPRYDYDSFCESGAAKIAALQAVKDYGFVVLTGVPCVEGQVLRVISEFGFVRETNYGPLFEVRSEVNANNLAFTNLGLGTHLDNPYRDPVPGLQLLHCLHSSTEGGESILQDGFLAATLLREENPQHFHSLTRHYIDFRYRNDDTDLQARAPMIEVNDLEQIIKVRYNNRSIAPLRLRSDQIADYYAAYRHFAEILQREALQISFKLDAGDLMLFDNTRVLHARRAFSAAGKRHLQGAYSDLDGLYSKLAVLQRQPSETHD